MREHLHDAGDGGRAFARGEVGVSADKSLGWGRETGQRGYHVERGSVGWGFGEHCARSAFVLSIKARTMGRGPGTDVARTRP